MSKLPEESTAPDVRDQERRTEESFDVLVRTYRDDMRNFLHYQESAYFDMIAILEKLKQMFSDEQ